MKRHRNKQWPNGIKPPECVFPICACPPMQCGTRKPKPIFTDQQVEDIVTFSYLTGKSLVDSAYAVLPEFDRAEEAQTWELTCKIAIKKKELDKEFKKTHS